MVDLKYKFELLSCFKIHDLHYESLSKLKLIFIIFSLLSLLEGWVLRGDIQHAVHELL